MRKRFTEFLLAVILFMALPGIALSQGYSGGSGTSGSPYKIATKADLAYLSANPGDWSKDFEQTADIVFTASDFQSGGSFYNSGAGFSPIGNGTTAFSGSYDGQGFWIANLTIRRSSTGFIGFFGQSTGSISYVRLQADSISGGQYTGGLVGYNTGTVSYCSTSGAVTGSSYFCGGLMAYNQGAVNYCYSTCTVTGNEEAGGFVGQQGGDTITDCFATGAVSASSYAGGFAGADINGAFKYCYSTGSVPNNGSSDGFLAYISSGSATGCFWDETTSGTTISAAGTGETTSAMQTPSTFTTAGWDSSTVWHLQSGAYPTLKQFLVNGITATTGAAPSITGTSAMLTGFVIAGSDTAAVRFLYGTTSGVYTDSVSATPDTATGSGLTSESASLTGLSAGTTYYYVIVAESNTSYVKGSENNFTAISPVWEYDLKFDGTSSYATSDKVVSTDTANVTIDAWVKWNGTTTGGTPLIASNGCADSNGYGLYLYLNNHLSVLVCAVGWLVSDSTLPVNTWTHVALVRSGGTFVLYENGVNLPFGYSGTSGTAATLPLIPASSFFVGGESSSHPDYFPGEIDEVRLSNMARYSSNFTPPTKPFTSDGNTLALYHFNEGSGSVAEDSSGNGNDLTLVNSPTWTGSDNPAGASDVSLAVQATDFIATSSAGSVTLTWETQSEVNNAGFNIFRQQLQPPNSEPQTQNWQLISSYATNDSLAGVGTSSTGRSYDFTDNHVTAGLTYKYKIESVSTNGATKELSTLTVTVGVPKTYALYQNYPNPFNPSTTIRFDLKEQSNVTLAIYNVLGQRVESWNYGMMEAGRYNKDVNMSRFASGVYFYRIIAKGLKGDRFVSIKKMLMIK